jgi:nucleotide-binding universal stress UspA family protein
VPVFYQEPVLVPIDYSEASLQAVRVAKSIAGGDSDVTLIYVAQDYDLTLHPLTWTGGPLHNYHEDRLLNGLRTWAKENNLGAVNLAVRSGDPGTQVCQFAEVMGCELIVLPSHGRHGLSRLLMGSVAERILRHCHCSALVLRPTKSMESVATSPGNWFPRKRVVVPIDFSDASSKAIEMALGAAENRDGIDIVSVVPTLDFVDFADTGITSDEDRINSCREYMSRYLTEHGYESLRTFAFVGDPGTMIVEHAGKVHADLIIMPSHGRHGLKRMVLGSTTERVLRHSDVPILVLRATAGKSAG